MYFHRHGNRHSFVYGYYLDQPWSDIRRALIEAQISLEVSPTPGRELSTVIPAHLIPSRVSVDVLRNLLSTTAVILPWCALENIM